MREHLVALDGTTYEPQGFVFTLVACQGFVLDLSATNLTDLDPTIRAALPADLSTTKDCQLGITKAGHDNTEGACFFNLNVEVQAGEKLGIMHGVANGHGGFTMEFETWAANYNVEPPAKDRKSTRLNSSH